MNKQYHNVISKVILVALFLLFSTKSFSQIKTLNALANQFASDFAAKENYQIIDYLWGDSYKDYKIVKDFEVKAPGKYTFVSLTKEEEDVPNVALKLNGSYINTGVNGPVNNSPGLKISSKEYTITNTGKYQLITHLKKAEFLREVITLVFIKGEAPNSYKSKGKTLKLEHFNRNAKQSMEYALNDFVKRFEEKSQWKIVKYRVAKLDKNKAVTFQNAFYKGSKYKVIVVGLKANSVNVHKNDYSSTTCIKVNKPSSSEIYPYEGLGHIIETWDFPGWNCGSGSWVGVTFPNTVWSSKDVYVFLAEYNSTNSALFKRDGRYFNYVANRRTLKHKEMEENKRIAQRDKNAKMASYDYNLTRIDDKGEKHILDTFQSAGSFNWYFGKQGQFITYMANGKYGVANATGDRITSPIARKPIEITRLENGLFRYRTESGYVYLYTEDGRNVSFQDYFTSGKYIIKKHKLFGLKVYDDNLNIVFKSPRGAEDFTWNSKYVLFQTYKSGNYATWVLNFKGDTISKLDYGIAGHKTKFMGDSLFVYQMSLNDKKVRKKTGHFMGMGVMDINGKVLLKPTAGYLDIIGEFTPNGNIVVRYQEHTHTAYGDNTKPHWGLVSKEGKWLVKPKYGGATGYSSNSPIIKFRMARGEPWVYYNHDGEKLKLKKVKRVKAIGTSGNYAALKDNEWTIYKKDDSPLFSHTFTKVEEIPGNSKKVAYYTISNKVPKFYNKKWEEVDLGGVHYTGRSLNDSILIVANAERHLGLVNTNSPTTPKHFYKKIESNKYIKNRQIVSVKTVDKGARGFINLKGELFKTMKVDNYRNYQICRNYLMVWEDNKWTVLNDAGEIQREFTDRESYFGIPEEDIWVLKRD